MGRDGIAGLACLAASLGLFAATLGLPEASLLVPVGPGFYPRIVLGVTAALSLLLVVQDVLARRRGVKRTPARAPAAGYGLVAITFAAFAAYVVLLPYLGFRIATFGFVGGLMAVLEPPQKKNGWIAVAAVAFVTSVVCYLVFERYLSVLLPRGRWTDF